MSDVMHHIKLPGDDEFREIIDEKAREGIEELKESKQDKLVAGENVTIDGNVISSKTATVTRDTINAALGVDVVEAIENTERELDEKQDVLTAGEGISIEGDVISATGGSSIDVQINGTSIVHGGVADIPLASSDKPGVVSAKTSGTYGISVNSFGELVIPQPQQAHIDSRSKNPRRVITTASINAAVTAALTDAKHIILNAEQQAVAQQVLGIYSVEGVAY